MPEGKKLSPANLRRIGRRYGFHLGEEELALFSPLVEKAVDACTKLDKLPADSLPVKYPRTAAQRPEAEENRFNAWSWRCSVQGASSGLLARRRLAMKETIPVAGIPMSNGSRILEGYIPDIDATVVTRVLDAGGEIVGMAATEDLCYAGGSVSAITGLIRNPWDSRRSAGGSSSGVAVVVASGEADMGIGGDQGGSVRIPASFSGVFGLKPTFGLVPFTGCAPIDPSLDHLGPIARTIPDLALLLEVIAGPDGTRDPRQPPTMRMEQYSKLLPGDISGIRVGVVKEGFAWDGFSQPDVDRCVLDAAGRMSSLGAVVEEISIPEHRDAAEAILPIIFQAFADFVMAGDGMGVGVRGYYNVGMVRSFRSGRERHADLVFDAAKLAILIGGCLRELYGTTYYAKAQNFALALREEYDAAFGSHDLLIMPTTPAKAALLPEQGAPRMEWLMAGEAPGVGANTAAANMTGHPALSVPIGPSEGLPVGLMVVGRHWADALVLSAGHALEQGGFTARLSGVDV
jgi:amidase